MSSPAERAARRKAILSRGGDRLAKLTTSARGEEATTYIQTDVPVRGAASGLGAFTGEETPPPPSLPPTAELPRASPPPPFFTAGGQPDPSTWSEEHQRQFMQALMGATSPSPFTLPHPPADDHLTAVMTQLAQANQGQGPAAGKAPASAAPPQPPSFLQNLLPLVHMLCMWTLLAFFVFWKEPQMFAEKTGSVEISLWERWQTLAQRMPDAGWWGVQLAPFFWTFMALQIMLHSIRIFSGYAQVQPPKLLALALPHLPPPLRSSITNGLQYMQLASLFMDDIAAIVFGIGVVILVATWLAP